MGGEGATMSPKQGWFESDEDYQGRVSEEANEHTIENLTGSAPSRGWVESEEDYSERIADEANEARIENSTGDAPSCGWFESENNYRERIAQEANERTIEDSTDSSPKRGWLESESDYDVRVRKEANEHIISEGIGSPPKQRWFEDDHDYRSRIAHEAREIRADEQQSSSTDHDTSSYSYSSSSSSDSTSSRTGSGAWLVLLAVIGFVFMIVLGQSPRQEPTPAQSVASPGNEDLDLKRCAETANAYCFIIMALKEVESESIDPSIRARVFTDAAALLSEAKRPEEAQRAFVTAQTIVGKISPKIPFWHANRHLIDKLLLAGYRDEANVLLREYETKVISFSGDEKSISQEDYQRGRLGSIPDSDLSWFMINQRDYHLADIAGIWSRLNETSKAKRSIDTIPGWQKSLAIENVVREEALAKRWNTAKVFVDRLHGLHKVSALCHIVEAAVKAENRDLTISLISEARRTAEREEDDGQKLLGYGYIVRCQSKAGLNDLVPQMIIDIDTLSLRVTDRYRVRLAQIDAAKALHKLGDVRGAKDRLIAVFSEVEVLADEGRRGTDLGAIAEAQAELGMFEEAVKTLRHHVRKLSPQESTIGQIPKAMLNNPNQVSDQAIIMMRNLFTDAEGKNSIDNLHARIRARKGDINGALDIIRWEKDPEILLEIAQAILSARM